MIGVRLLFIVLCLGVSLQGLASERLTYEQKVEDIDQVVTLVKSQYGPFEYKKAEFGIDVDALREKYVALAETTNDGQFYYMMLQMVAEYRDSHFGAWVPTDHKATLGFFTEFVDGKVLIESIDRDKLTEENFDFERGDEIISIDGDHVFNLMGQLSSYKGLGFMGTQLRVGARRISVRQGRSVPVPTGMSEVLIRRGTSDIVETVELEWQEEGEALDESIRETKKETKMFLNAFSQIRSFQLQDFQLSIHDIADELNPNVEQSYQCNPGTRVAIPKDATILMEEPFVAYYHPTEKGNVGYLRIPHYYWRDDEGNMINDERLVQYEWAVKKLEENTVGLIIDQDHNCGGSVLFLEQMASLFIREAFTPLEFQFLASKGEYLKFKGWLNSEPEHTLLTEYFAKTVDLVKKHWLLGDFLTPMTTFTSDLKRQPHPYGYTKPIVMLIDEMSGSGGDAFPALLQGHGRAMLLGTRTMGAGGHVEGMPSLNHSGIQLRMTKSLFFRPDGIAVENNGAVPDIDYTITRDDFLYDYKGYQKFYLDALLERVE